MTERTIPGGNFTPGTQEGDPGKLKYLHTPDWKGTPSVGTRKLNVDERVCPGCLFPDAPEGKWPHVKDERCERFRFAALLLRKIVEGSRPIDTPAVCQGNAL